MSTSYSIKHPEPIFHDKSSPLPRHLPVPSTGADGVFEVQRVFLNPNLWNLPERLKELTADFSHLYESQRLPRGTKTHALQVLKTSSRRWAVSPSMLPWSWQKMPMPQTSSDPTGCLRWGSSSRQEKTIATYNKNDGHKTGKPNLRSKTWTFGVLVESFRRLAWLHHPDKGGDPERRILFNAIEDPSKPKRFFRFKEISFAYEVLSDPERRVQYDAKGHGHWRS